MEHLPWIALKAYSEAEHSRISPALDLPTFDRQILQSPRWDCRDQQAVRLQEPPLLHARSRVML